MTERLTLVAQPREMNMTPRALRRSGLVPGVIYGNQFEAIPLQFGEPALRRLLNSVGKTHLFNLTIEDQDVREMALVRDIQRHPINGALLHVDLYRVVAGEAITTSVSLQYVGESPAVEEGGSVTMSLDSIEIQCLPGDMPNNIEVDLSVLAEMDSVIRVEDLVIPEGVTVLSNADTVVARVVAPRAEEEVEVEEAAGEEAGAEAEAAGETEESSETSEE